MSKTSRTALSVEQIAEKASRGEDVSAYFTNKFAVVRPVRRVSVDLTHGMLPPACRPLARAARGLANLNLTRVISTP
jgi:hypothetical protein